MFRYVSSAGWLYYPRRFTIHVCAPMALGSPGRGGRIICLSAPPLQCAGARGYNAHLTVLFRFCTAMFRYVSSAGWLYCPRLCADGPGQPWSGGRFSLESTPPTAVRRRPGR
jgi:hypothetical protein